MTTPTSSVITSKQARLPSTSSMSAPEKSSTAASSSGTTCPICLIQQKSRVPHPFLALQRKGWETTNPNPPALSLPFAPAPSSPRSSNSSTSTSITSLAPSSCQSTSMTAKLSPHFSQNAPVIVSSSPFLSAETRNPSLTSPARTPGSLTSSASASSSP